MARGKKWEVPFVSLNGTSCRVEIWVEGHSGGTTTLLGADAPFTFEESTNQNLLDFVRTKSGYIRVVEQADGALNDLYPSYMTQNYVKVYYGNDLVFTGYMQCAEYSADWIAPPTVKEFPVVSPLGLLGSFKFSAQSPNLTRVGSLLKEIMQSLSSDYEQVIYPADIVTQPFTAGKAFPWDGEISSLAVCPFNEDFQHWSDSNELYNPKDYGYFINSICACFGWMVHDTPDTLVFTKYNNDGKYCQLSVSDLDSASYSTIFYTDSESTLRRIENYYNVAGDDGSLSVKRPLRKITVSTDGAGAYDGTLSTKYGKNYGYMVSSAYAQGQRVGAFLFESIAPNVTGDHLISTPPSFHERGLYAIAYGVLTENEHLISFEDAWVVRCSSSWAAGTSLIKARFYGIPIYSSTLQSLIKITLQRGPNLAELSNNGYDNITFNMVVKVDGKYYRWQDGADYYSDQKVVNSITIDGTTGKIIPNTSSLADTNLTDIDGFLFRPTPASDGLRTVGVIEISIESVSALIDLEYLIFDISIASPVDNKYVPDYGHKNSYEIDGSAKGLDDASISAGINNFTQSIGRSTFGDGEGKVNGTIPSLSYMFSPQHFLEVPMRQWAQSLPENIYLPRYTFWKDNSWRWRLIGMKFDLRNDMYRLTLAHTPNL